MKNKRKKFIKFLKGHNTYNEFVRLSNIWIGVREHMLEYDFREKYYSRSEIEFAKSMYEYTSVEDLIKKFSNPIQEAFPWVSYSQNISWSRLSYEWRDIYTRYSTAKRLS